MNIPVPFSREHLLELLLVIPAIIVLFGLWGIICAGVGCCCCCRKRPDWQKVPISWMTGCTFLQMPCVFLWAGFFFVFVILWVCPVFSSPLMPRHTPSVAVG